MINVELVAVGLAALMASLVMTALLRRLALAHGVLDVPNQRSSHDAPTPRGGGAAIVVATTGALLALAWIGTIRVELLLALAVGGAAVALVGFMDDRRRLRVSVRFAVHVAAALWALGWLGGLAPLRLGGYTVNFGWSGYVLGVLGIVWVLNLFNFMDGIDGIAGSEATFVAWAGAALAAGASSGSAALVFGAACVGFLRWNWPPARIFMGDVGSGYLGYVVAVLALASMHDSAVAIWVWLILGGVFFVDATVTLLRRLSRGQRVYQAHRSHAYQWLARRWGSHLRVTLALLGVDVCWLLPCAAFAALHPRYAAATTVLAFTPLVVLALAAGSGRSERAGPPRS